MKEENNEYSVLFQTGQEYIVLYARDDCKKNQACLEAYKNGYSFVEDNIFGRLVFRKGIFSPLKRESASTSGATNDVLINSIDEEKKFYETYRPHSTECSCSDCRKWWEIHHKKVRENPPNWVGNHMGC